MPTRSSPFRAERAGLLERLAGLAGLRSLGRRRGGRHREPRGLHVGLGASFAGAAAGGAAVGALESGLFNPWKIQDAESSIHTFETGLCGRLGAEMELSIRRWLVSPTKKYV